MSSISKGLVHLGLLAVVGSILTGSSAARADVLSCPKRDGTMRMWDGELNECKNVDENITDWTAIGSPRWNDRFDDFGNDDFSTVIAFSTKLCLYEHKSYGGRRVTLHPGYRVFWANIVSSNRWIFLGSC